MNIPSTSLNFFNHLPLHYFNFSTQQTFSLTSPISKMSDTLADLASWLPSEFLAAEMDDKTLFLNTRPLPYDIASSSSTESESDDDDISGLTCRFTRSVSLQERLKIPYAAEKKRGFSGSPESTLNWNLSAPTQVLSSPTTPFVQEDKDAWGVIYAAAGKIARMKMNNLNGGVFGAPRPLAPNISHHNQSRGIWSETEVFFRPQQFRERFTGGLNYGGGARFVDGRPVGFGQPAWLPHPVERQQRKQPADEFAFKPVGRSSGGCGREYAVVKKECSGTGVFLPRNYSNVSPESMNNPVSSPAHLPARVAQSFNKNLDPMIAQPRANIHGVFSRQHQVPLVPHSHLKSGGLAEKIMVHRLNTVMPLQQRRSGTHEGVPATRTGQAEVVLPQEWTY